MDYIIDRYETFDDKRGRLIVFLRERQLKIENKQFGQIYFITFNDEGIVRGNHYHKEWREWFGVVIGEVQVELKDIITKERISLILNAEDKQYVRLEIGPHIAHAFKSMSPTASLLNYASGEWNPNDTFRYKLL